MKKRSSVKFLWLVKFRYLQLLLLSLLVQAAQSWKEMLHLCFLHLDHLWCKGHLTACYLLSCQHMKAQEFETQGLQQKQFSQGSFRNSKKLMGGESSERMKLR